MVPSLSPSVYGQSVTFTATVTAGGQPVTAGAVTFTDGSTVLGTVNVNSTGHAAYTTHTLSAAPSSHQITATYNGGGGGGMSSDTEPQVVTPAPLRITADNKSKVAGQPVPTLTATYSGFVNGDTPANLTTPVTLSTYTGNVAGSYAIVPSGASSPNYNITFVNGTLTITAAAATSLRLSAPATVTAGQAFSFTVSAVDPYGNVDTNYLGSCHLTTTDPQSPDLGTGVFTSTDHGTIGFAGIALYTAGSQSILASGALSGQTNLTVTPAAAASFLVSTPSVVVAGQAFSFTISALDPYGNVDTNYLGSCHLTTTDPQSSDLGTGIFASTDHGVIGFAGIALYTAGPQTITASGTLFGQASLTVSPAAAASLVLSNPGNQTAGALFSVTVTAYDPYGNVATGYTGTVSLTSTDPQAASLGSYTFTGSEGGTYTFNGLQLFTAGFTSIFASDGTLGAEADLMVNPDVAAFLVVSGPSTATAGLPFSVTVTAYDAWGNVATGYTGTVTFSSDDPAGSLPGDYAFQPGDQGSQTFQVTLQTPGTHQVTATDTSNPSITGFLNVTV
jgi:hypothetical protein